MNFFKKKPKIYNHYIFWIVFVIFFLMAIGYSFFQHLPYQNFAARQIINTLQSKNIKVSSLKVETINSSQISLSDIRLDYKLPIDLANLKIYYEIKNLKLAKINAQSTGVNLALDPYKLVIGDINLKAFLNDNQKWQGEVVIPVVTIVGLQSDPLLLSAKINFVLDEETLSANIRVRDKQNTTKADMVLSMPIGNMALGNLNIKQIQFPWGGGIVSSSSVNLPIEVKNPILFDINLSLINGYI